MNPLYFGTSDRRLFGVYHPPATGRMRDRAVVLCGPAFAEYLRCHRALRQLAIVLARRGFPTLRFDYYATGDSAGDGIAATIHQWQEDVVNAIEEALALGNRERASIIGLRLGATLGCMVGCRHPAVTEAALWDPVVTGPQYLEELAQQHGAAPAAGPDYPDEVLGFPLSAPLRDEIGGLNLASADVSSLRRVLLIHNADSADHDALADGWLAGDVDFGRSRVAGTKVWTQETANSRELVPMPTLELLADWIDGSESTR